MQFISQNDTNCILQGDSSCENSYNMQNISYSDTICIWKDMSRSKLTDYIRSLQEKAVYTFSQDEAQTIIGESYQSLRLAIQRLIKKGEIVRLCRGFFAIVPIEYKRNGSPPPDWFIDDLMKYLKQPYYIGILTAAALHGASHQQPYEFQVVTNKQIRPLKIGRSYIKFYTKNNIQETSTLKIKTYTGFVNVSTPESTAFDLLRYVKAAGHLQNIATVLMELSEKIDPNTLVKATANQDVANVQRLGYLLDQFSESRITDLLHKWVSTKRIKYYTLRPRIPYENSPKDERWRLWINEEIEADL